MVFFLLKSYLEEVNNIFSNHIKLTAGTSAFLVFFIWFNIVILSFFFILRKASISVSSDFFFILSNLMFLLLSFFIINTLLLFFFVLEVNSLLILYKFVISKKWYKKDLNSVENTFSKQKKINAQSYLNTLFFQYWTMFCSSTIFLFVFVILIGVFNAVDWTFLNFIHYINNVTMNCFNDFFFF